MNTTCLTWLYAWKTGGFQRGGYVDEQYNFFPRICMKK